MQVSDLGLVTLENGGVWLRQGGRRVEVALPPGADPELVAVAGRLGVAPVPEGALIVFDLRSGVEVRQVSLGAYDPVNLDGLALSPTGDVAATVPAGDGTGVLVWAPAGASSVRALARGASRLGRVAVAGGRVAYVTGAGLSEGVRPMVVDPPTRREVLRGPPVYDVTSLSFDGAWLGFSTPSCLYVASASALRLPAGPCARTEVAAEPRAAAAACAWPASTPPLARAACAWARRRAPCGGVRPACSACRAAPSGFEPWTRTAARTACSDPRAARPARRIARSAPRPHLRAHRTSARGAQPRGLRVCPGVGNLSVGFRPLGTPPPARRAPRAPPGAAPRGSPGHPAGNRAARPASVRFSARPSSRRRTQSRASATSRSAAPRAPATWARRSVQS